MLDVFSYSETDIDVLKGRYLIESGLPKDGFIKLTMVRFKDPNINERPKITTTDAEGKTYETYEPPVVVYEAKDYVGKTVSDYDMVSADDIQNFEVYIKMIYGMFLPVKEYISKMAIATFMSFLLHSSHCYYLIGWFKTNMNDFLEFQCEELNDKKFKDYITRLKYILSDIIWFIDDKKMFELELDTRAAFDLEMPTVEVENNGNND